MWIEVYRFVFLFKSDLASLNKISDKFSVALFPVTTALSTFFAVAIDINFVSICN